MVDATTPNPRYVPPEPERAAPAPEPERRDIEHSADPTDVAVYGGSALEVEYASLREEVVKRIESRQQLLSITLTVGGAFLGIGWGTNAVALLLFVPLAALLASGWAQNEVRIEQLNGYIRDHLEPRMPGMGWERYRRAREARSPLGGWTLDALSVGAIFLVLQLLAVFLSLFRATGSLVEWVLLVLAALSMLAVIALLDYVLKESR